MPDRPEFELVTPEHLLISEPDGGGARHRGEFRSAPRSRAANLDDPAGDDRVYQGQTVTSELL
jgi:hypothetical protein